MKWFILIPAAALLLTLATAARGGEPSVPEPVAPAQPGESLRMPAAGLIAYPDYPAEAYPPGFSSYRGTGFVGFCCEQNCPDVEALWQGYCETKGHHAKLFPHKCLACKPGLAPVTYCAKPCCGATHLGVVAKGRLANPWLPPTSCAVPGCQACGRSNGLAPTPEADAAPVPPQVPVPLATPDADPRTTSTPTPPEVPAPQADPATTAPILPPPPQDEQSTRRGTAAPNRARDASIPTPYPMPHAESAWKSAPYVLRAWPLSF